MKASLFLLFTSTVLAQTLPATYPALDKIPAVIPALVATINWKTAQPAKFITACPKAGD